MLRLKKIVAAGTSILVVATAITTAYIWTARHSGPTSDEFFVYAAFLSRLSRDGQVSLDRFALANTSSKLVAATGDNWIPAELRPYPPDEAEADQLFTDFCGSLCAREFMTKNLRSWRLQPTSVVQFPFGIVTTSAEPSSVDGGKRVVSVTRPGFDLWHHRAVFSYSFDCNGGVSPARDEYPISCVQFGQVLMERINGQWQVTSYTAFLV
jgi:hypothetical protein